MALKAEDRYESCRALADDIERWLAVSTRRNHPWRSRYLTQLQDHADAVAARPGRWMPWNYRETLAVSTPPDRLNAPPTLAGRTRPTGTQRAD